MLELNARASKTVNERFNFMKLLRAFGLRRLDGTFNHVLVWISEKLLVCRQAKACRTSNWSRERAKRINITLQRESTYCTSVELQSTIDFGFIYQPRIWSEIRNDEASVQIPLHHCHPVCG